MKTEYNLTISSKGQVTLPIELRRSFNVKEKGDMLRLILSDDGKSAQLEKPVSIEELRAFVNDHKKPGVEPLLDARALYDTREPRI